MWRRRGFNKPTLISAVLTEIPVGHHSAEKLPSSPSPLTLVALLICCCPTLSIQQSLLFYSFSLAGSVHFWWICTVVRPPPRCLANPESLNLTPLSLFQDEQTNRAGGGKPSPDWQRVIFYISSAGIEHCGALFQTTEER